MVQPTPMRQANMRGARPQAGPTFNSPGDPQCGGQEAAKTSSDGGSALGVDACDLRHPAARDHAVAGQDRERHDRVGQW